LLIFKASKVSIYHVDLTYSKLYLLIIGYTLNYIASAPCLIVALPEIMNVISNQESLPAEYEEFNNKAAGIYNAMNSLGSIVAPILSGALNVRVGY
jgi:MFS family permease